MSLIFIWQQEAVSSFPLLHLLSPGRIRLLKWEVFEETKQSQHHQGGRGQFTLQWAALCHCTVSQHLLKEAFCQETVTPEWSGVYLPVESSKEWGRFKLCYPMHSICFNTTHMCMSGLLKMLASLYSPEKKPCTLTSLLSGDPEWKTNLSQCLSFHQVWITRSDWTWLDRGSTKCPPPAVRETSAARAHGKWSLPGSTGEAGWDKSRGTRWEESTDTETYRRLAGLETSTESQRVSESARTMTRHVLLPLLLVLSVVGSSHGCLPDPVSAYRLTGAVCRLTYPAAVVCECDLHSGF